MNLRKIIILSVLLLTFTLLNGQESFDSNSKKNTLSIEAVGTSASPLSLNYDRVLFMKPNYHINLSLGFGYFPSVKDWNPIIGIPLTINISMGKTKHFFEVGTGLTYNSGLEQSGYDYFGDFSGNSSIADAESVKGLLWAFRLGYKYQRPTGGFFLRVGFTPLFRIKTLSDLKPENKFIPAFGLGIGYSF